MTRTSLPSTDASDDSVKIERILAALWVEVLQLKNPPGATDDFFSLGGDSMAMVTLEFRIQEELPVHLSPGTLLATPTLGELAQFVESLMANGDTSQESGPSLDPNEASGSPTCRS